ncbi:MAG: PKD domain-containing protein [Bacteroidales bacterium]|nr:PKD domain-containing protein [Bacteroidales bacterium]MCF8454620.1 PKD domain-containing protein [Bacteroidales bacterium]
MARFPILFFLFLLSANIAFAQIAVSVQSGCAPLAVSFSYTNSSLMNPHWDFDDGISSFLANPAHSFFMPGDYMVTLSGFINSIPVTDSVEIFVYPNPDAGFYIDGPNMGCASLSVQFVDTSLSGGIAPIVSHYWDFGDGAYADTVDLSLSHMYTAPGIYDVSLLVTDTNGCQSQIFHNSAVAASSPPIVLFSNNLDSLTDCTPPASVEFHAFAYSQFQYANSFNYHWDFGIQQSNVASPNVNFMPGNYACSLMVSDTFGCSVLHTFDLIGILPQASFSLANSPDSVICDSAIFLNTSNVPDVWWDYGDGGTGTDSFHVYNSPGIYTVQLFASLGLCTDSAELTLVVETVQAHYSLNPVSACSAPITVQYTDSSINAAEWFWIFPNGDTSLLQNPTVVYSDPDTSLCGQADSIFYQPTLIVTSAYGCRDTISDGPEFVFDMPVSRFMPNVSWGFAPLEVHFSDSTYMSGSIVSWHWDFGDGSDTLVFTDTISHLFSFPGDYDVLLTVTNDSGCTDISYPVTITVLDSTNYFQDFLPISMEVCTCFPDCGSYPLSFYSAYNLLLNKMNFDSISPEPISNFVNDTGLVDFTRREEREGQIFEYPIAQPQIKVLGPLAAITYDYDCDSVYQYTFYANAIDADNLVWDFGDSTAISTGALDTVAHVYQQSGNYLVKLSAYNNATSCTFSDSIWIYARHPLASFSFPDKVCAHVPVTFSGASSVDVYTHCTNGYQWVFGDNSPIMNTSDTSFQHTYHVGGKYKVELTVYDENACSHSVSDSIQVYEIHAQYDLSPSVICSPDSVFFTDHSYADTTLVSWDFEYGNGENDTIFPAWHFYSNPVSGMFITHLQVTDALGCTDYISHSFYLSHPHFSVIASDTALCLGDSVSFSTDPVFADISWDFGDGTSSTLPNPQHTYSTPGIYNVSAIGVDTFGCADTSSYSKSIEVFALPDAMFATSFTGDTLCVDQDMIFTIISDTATLSDWCWVSPSTYIHYDTPWIGFSTLHPGDYGCSLTVTDINGCTDTYIDSFILIGPYLYFTTFTGIICQGEEAIFHINYPTDVDGWVVDFGDGNIDSSQNLIIHHTYDPNYYPASGSEFVYIYYWNDDCTVNTASQLVFRPKAVADFSLVNWSDSVICLDDAITLSNNSVNSTSWLWDMGVGPPLTGFNLNSFQYPTVGNYEISLIASSQYGCKDTATLPVLVTGVYPDLGINTQVICVNGLASFTDNSSADAGISSWYMLFGDGGSSNTFQNSHYYSNPPSGTGYNIMLSITDNFGCTAYDTQFIPFNDPVANFTVSNADPCEMEIINFQSYSTFANYVWNLGTGPPQTTSNPEIFYPQSGLYTISLIAEDALGCKDTVEYTNYIHVHEIPVAGFSFTPNQNPQCAPATITFTDSSSCPDPYSIEWLYNSGPSSANPLDITWTTPGQFDVGLHVTSAFGCENSSSTIIEIEAPVAQLNIEPDEICWGDTVTFTISNPISLFSWEWDFGDGNTLANNPNFQVSHKYVTMPPSGQFEITLTLHSQNCESVITQYIDAFLPVSNFDVENPVCAGQPIQFTNTSQIANEFTWHFGDNSSSTNDNPQHTYTERGTYNAVLTAVYQPLGCTDARMEIITVYDPELTLQTPGDSICLGTPVSFGLSTLIDVNNWKIEYGDGGEDSGYTNTNLQHTYPYGFSPPNGKITVKLTLWSPDAICTKEIYKNINIYNVHARIGSQNEPDFIICHGDHIILLDQSINSDNIVWDFGDGMGNAYTSPVVHQYPYAGSYTIKLDIYDIETTCSDKATKTLQVRSDAVINSPAFYSCEGEPVQLSFSVEGGATAYTWSPGDLLDDSTSATPIATITEYTGFQLSVVDGYGCSGSANVWVDYIVAPPEIQWVDSVIIGDTIQIFTDFDPVFNLLWSNNGTLNCDNCPDPVAFTLQSNTYYLTVSDPGGCFDKVSEYTVFVREEDKFSMPTVFTPNGDGLNDVFKVEGWGIKQVLEFKVYNRWGELVFATDNKLEGWDGTYKGKNQASDTYTYIVRVEMWVGSNVHEKKGFINLIR